MSRSRRYPSLLAVLLVITVFGFLGAGYTQKNAPPAVDAELSDRLRQFSEVYDLVERNYAEPIDPNKAIYNGAIPGMLHLLDPHSNFFDPKSYSSLREQQRAKYYGVGMTIAPRHNK